MPNINKIPFFRFLVPFVLGILSINVVAYGSNALYYLLASFVGVSTLYLMHLRKVTSKWVFLISVDVFLFLFAAIYTHNVRSIEHQNSFVKYLSEKDAYLYVKVSDLPVPKERSIQMQLTVLGVSHHQEFAPAAGKIMAYLSKQELQRIPAVGELMLIPAKINEVQGPMNPDAFDFRAFMNRRGIYFTTYVKAGTYRLCGKSSHETLFDKGLMIKHRIIERMRHAGLNTNAFSICIALLTGYDDEIDKDVIERFSHSGTLHILSVSGLHVGLIYVFLNFILGLADKKDRHLLLRFGLVVAILWVFALITGFSPPVLRSVIMFCLLGIGKYFFKGTSSNQLNVLFVSAFILLLIDPFWLYDTGFLLSYSAMFGILYFYPKLVKLHEPNSRLSSYVWQSTVMSVSATVATLPVSLYMFHQFPIWFILANLIMVPFTSVLLLLSSLALLNNSVISAVINWLIDLMLKFIEVFNDRKMGYADMIHFNLWDVLFLVVLIIIVTRVFMTRNFQTMVSMFIVLITWQIFALMDSYEAKQDCELVVYHSPRSSVSSLKNGNTTLVDVHGEVQLNRVMRPNLIRYNYTDTLHRSFDYVSFQNKGIFFLRKGTTFHELGMRKVSHLVISNNAVPDLEMLDKWDLDLVIADASNSAGSIDKIKELCFKKGLPFYNIKQKGAFVVKL